MNAYNFKWSVKIPAKQFMAGTHRFRTKKEAQEFVYKWNRSAGKTTATYDQLPRPIKDHSGDSSKKEKAQ